MRDLASCTNWPSQRQRKARPGASSPSPIAGPHSCRSNLLFPWRDPTRARSRSRHQQAHVPEWQARPRRCRTTPACDWLECTAWEGAGAKCHRYVPAPPTCSHDAADTRAAALVSTSHFDDGQARSSRWQHACPGPPSFPVPECPAVDGWMLGTWETGWRWGVGLRAGTEGKAGRQAWLGPSPLVDGTSSARPPPRAVRLFSLFPPLPSHPSRQTLLCRSFFKQRLLADHTLLYNAQVTLYLSPTYC